MKKILLATILILAVSANMEAQLVKFGIKAGLNYANQTGTDLTIGSNNYNREAITSYHAGLIAEIKLTDGFSVQPELLYSTQGASYKNATTEFKNELGYLSIPVLAKFHFNKTVSLDLGPQASFLLSERKIFDVSNAETFEFGLAGGLGINITKNLFIQGRYVVGLTEASKDFQAKNSVLQISAGISF